MTPLAAALREASARQSVWRLERLGFQVTLHAAEAELA
jgi:hypothetical protein